MDKNTIELFEQGLGMFIQALRIEKIRQELRDDSPDSGCGEQQVVDNDKEAAVDDGQHETTESAAESVEAPAPATFLGHQRRRRLC